MTNQEMQQKIEDLQKQIDEMKNFNTIPFDVGGALKARIIPNGTAIAKFTTGTPSTVTVNEGGVGTVVAAAPFTYQALITFENTTLLIPVISVS